MISKSLEEKCLTLTARISQFYVGNSGNVVEMLLIALIAGGHVLLEGVPGLAKTTVAKLFASSVGLDFKRLQCTSDTMPSDFIGTHIFKGKEEDFVFVKGPIFTQIFLVDEINRASPRSQSALLEAMQEGQVTSEGERYILPKPYMVIATQNPAEQKGVYALTESASDRFLFRVRMSYPSFAEESRIASSPPLKTPPAFDPVFAPDDIEDMANIAENITVHNDLLHYALTIVRATRESAYLSLGASPRAAQWLMRAAKVRALLRNRDYLSPEDIRELVVPVLAHRIVPAAHYQGIRAEDILTEMTSYIKYA